MAEILGVVASGISMVQIASSLMTATLKIRGFLHEIHDIPGRLEFLLEQIEVLVPILSQIDTNSSLPPLPSCLNDGLQRAVLHCQKAAEQLESLATDLSSEMESCRGFKRKLKSTKAIMKKDVLETCEKRLSMALQSLALAQQTYMLSLQRMQPQNIALEVLRQLRAAQALQTLSVESQGEGTDGEESTTLAVVGHTCRPHQRHGTAVQAAALPVSTEDVLFRLKFHTPSWLGSRVFESILLQSQIGWTHVLNVYRVWSSRSKEWQMAVELIKKDDVSGLQQIFQKRLLSPVDRSSAEIGRFEISLFGEAVWACSWKICCYLLDVRSPQLFDRSDRDMWKVDEATLYQLNAFLKHDDLEDKIRYQLMSYYVGDGDSFRKLRCQLWPDYEFYSTAFRALRCSFFRLLIWRMPQQPFIPNICRYVLSQSGHISDISPDFYSFALEYNGLNQGLPLRAALMIGGSVWEDRPVFEDACQLAQEIIKNNPDPLSLTKPDYTGRTPFLYLLVAVLSAPARKRPWRTFKSRQCSKAIDMATRAWLLALKGASIDIEGYGRVEKQCTLKAKERSKDFQLPRNSHLLKIRLISFDYGRHVDDWKLWWSEATDELVGDFWKQQDPELAYCGPMPGAWVE